MRQRFDRAFPLLSLFFGCMILAITRDAARGAPDLKALLHEATAATATSSQNLFDEKVAVLREVAKAQATIGDRDGARGSIDVALLTLSQASTTREYLASLLVELSEASAGGDPVELERTLKRAAGISRTLTLDRHDGYALLNLAAAMARLGDPSGAIGRARGIADANDRQAALITIAEIEAKAASRTWVERSVAASRGPVNRISILARVATIWAEAGDIIGARWGIAEALRLANRIWTKPWQNYALVQIAKAQVAAHDLRGALRGAGRIETSRDAQDLVEVLTAVAVAQARDGDKAGGLASLKRGRETALRLPAETRFKPGSPRSEALAKIAAAYAQIGAADTGSAVARSIPKEAPGREYLAAEALLAIARVQATAGDSAGALVRCEEALTLLSNPSDVVRYRWVCGDRLGAWRVVRENPGASAALWGLARAEARAGNLTDALKAAGAIRDDRERVLALASLVPFQAALGDVADARETASKVTDASRRAYALQAVAWARARGGDLQGAVDEAAMEQNPLARSRMLLGVVEAQLGWSTEALSFSVTTEQPWDPLPLKP